MNTDTAYLFGLLRQQGYMLDALILSEDGLCREPCHRLLGAAHSRLLREYFDGVLPGPDGEYVLQLPGRHLAALVGFMYGDPLPVAGPDDTLEALAVAQALGMPLAVEALENRLVDCLGPGTCLRLWSEAKASGLLFLEMKALEFLCENMPLLDRAMAACDVSMIRALVEDPYASCSEFRLAQLAVSWVRASPEDRVERLPELLAPLRLHMEGPARIRELEVDPLVARRARHLTAEALLWLKTEPWRRDWGGAKEPRHGNTAKWLLVWEHRNNLGERGMLIHREDADSKPGDIVRFMVKSPPCPGKQAIAVLNNCLYMSGGQDRQRAGTNGFARYDPLTNSWLEMPSFLCHRTAHQLTAFGGELWLTGGRRTARSGANHSVEIYNPMHGRWRGGPDLAHSCAEHTATSAGDRLYAVGGNAQEPNACQVYCPAKAKWEPIPPVPLRGQGNRTAVGVGDVLVVFEETPRGVAAAAYRPDLDAWMADYPLLPHRMGIMTAVDQEDGTAYLLLERGARGSAVFDPRNPTRPWSSVKLSEGCGAVRWEMAAQGFFVLPK